uniref:Uncharacterized protein n=1 Tax=Cacopsylla melanoneura TaxID=428564 RepID=A0A8D9B3S5_9HEMI
MHTAVFQIFSVLSQVNIARPFDKPLIGPYQGVGINVLTLMSSHSQCLPVIFHHTKQMNTVHYGSLMKLARNGEELLQLFLAQMIQHARIHHVGGEIVSVLRETKVRQPF